MYLVKNYKKKSRIEGNGVFAGEFIPKGTIVYYYCARDNSISKNDFHLLPKHKRDRIFKCGVEDETGSWHMAEREGDGDANHSCEANILPIFIDNIYCDIAVEDINVGEEITIDYGLFFSSIQWRIECKCNSPICRKIVGSGFFVDIETQELWNLRISDAVNNIVNVNQPLYFVDDERAKKLASAMRSKRNPKIYPYIKFSLIS